MAGETDLTRLTPRPGERASLDLSFVRHELRTPLNQILGYSQLLMERAEELGQPDLVNDLARVEAAGRRLLGLIDQHLGGVTSASVPPPPPAPGSERGGFVAGILKPGGPGEPPRSRETVVMTFPEPPSKATAGKASILVVDDNEMNRDMLARRLSARGYDVRVAEGGEEALRDIEGGAKLDLVLLDVMMPGISGIDVLRKVRQSFGVTDLPIIMATARDASEDVVEALKLGANDYVTKPLDFAVVLARVETQISLKRASEKILDLNSELLDAQERITRLVESSEDAVRDVPAWARSMADDIAAAVGAPEIGVFALDESGLIALNDTGRPTPDIESLKASARTRDTFASGGDTVVPVTGMSGETFGALVVAEKEIYWGSEERRLLMSFAHQLGGALELLKTKHDLEKAKDRRATSRQDMLAKGVDLLQVCSACGSCYDHRVPVCRRDGSALEVSRLLPYRLLGRYRMVRLLATGGMGTVFHAVDETLERDVAVKILNPEHFHDASVRLRFQYEAKAVARVDHPGVIRLFDSGELEDGSLYLVMEKLSGSDVANLLHLYGRGTPRQVARLLRGGAAGLAAAHRAGLVHRDIKPENVFLVDEPDGFHVKILDFGVAKQLQDDPHLTRTGLIVGTPAYMSPEQVSSEKVDARSDLYSFAAVGYEALTGRRVTLESELARIFVDVLQNQPPRVSSILSGVPPEVDRAFAQAFAKEPALRPWDVEQWVGSFAHVLDKLPVTVSGWPEAGGNHGTPGRGVATLAPGSELPD